MSSASLLQQGMELVGNAGKTSVLCETNENIMSGGYFVQAMKMIKWSSSILGLMITWEAKANFAKKYIK